MREYYFSIANQLTLAIRSDSDFDNPQIITKLGAFLPDCTRIEDYSRPHDVLVEHFNGAATGLEIQPRHVMLTIPKSERIPEDLFHLLYGVVRKELIEQKCLYCIHAACVEQEGDFRLLAGHSGAGKTTMAQHVVDAGAAKLASGNKTLIGFDKDTGALQFKGGTKTMTALDDQGKRFSYRLPAHKVTPVSDAPIQSVDLIRLNDGASHCETLSAPSALHTLYPLMMDQVNADVILGEGTLYDGGITTQMKQELIPQLRDALKQTSVRKIAGSKSFIARHLAP